MADELRLDIIVDDHGAVQKLEDVDKGVNKITKSADGSKGALDELGKRFGVNTVNLQQFTAETGAAEAGVARYAGVIAGVGVGALTLYAGLLGQAAREADGLVQASDNLEAPAARLAQLAEAAEGYSVSGERMNSVLEQFRQRLASGQIDGKLRDIGIELDAFKAKNVAEEFLDITDAIGQMEEPLDRVNARVKLLGPDTQDMAAMMTTGFRDATDGAHAMKEETIQFMDDLIDSMKNSAREAGAIAKNLAADSLVAVANAFGRRNFQGPAAALGQPDAPLAPGRQLPDPLGTVPGSALPGIENEMRLLELQKQEEENWFRIDEIMRQIDGTQKLIVKSGGDWSEVLNSRVAVAVDAINAKFVTAVMLNNQLRGDAAGNRDQLMKQLTATTNPNESEFDRRFNEIDQQAKAKLAMVDQADRLGAAAAENAILEEMNLKVLELQTKWEGATRSVDDHRKAVEGAGQSLRGLGGGAGSPFGPQLPPGLTMPTADQVATGRYFGPVDANGRPDPGRMGGATPMQNIINVNAPNSFNTNGWDELVSLIEQGLARRDQNLGVKARR